MTLTTMILYSVVFGLIVGIIVYVCKPETKKFERQASIRLLDAPFHEKIHATFIGLIVVVITFFVLTLFPNSKAQPPTVNATLTRFLNFEPVQNGTLDGYTHYSPGQYPNIAIEANERKMDAKVLCDIMNHETYLIRIPDGYTVKLIPPYIISRPAGYTVPVVKPEVTEIPPTSNQ